MKKLILAIGLITSSHSYSEIYPTTMGFDPRIVGIEYNPFDVIKVKTKIGINTLIKLENGESINSPESGIGMGDSNAWGFSVRGSNIFFKPKAKLPDTNLTVVSDLGRTYSFILESSKTPYHIINMQYEKKKIASDYANNIYPCSDGGKINLQWQKWGDEKLAPQYMWDDGRFTCLKYSENLELPVIYKISTDGKESLVNYHIEQDTLVLHDVANEFRARLGDRVLGLKSVSTIYAGFNHKATTINAKREVK